jgi:hypothetical protein
MALQTLGSQSGDTAKTPTLRQYAKNRDGKVPQISSVKTIFSPAKFGNYTLLTDHNFRVQVSEENELHGIITDHIEEWIKTDTSLFVKIVDGLMGEWELTLNTDESSVWTEKEWGWTLEIKDRKPATKKKPLA